MRDERNNMLQKTLFRTALVLTLTAGLAAPPSGDLAKINEPTRKATARALVWLASRQNDPTINAVCYLLTAPAGNTPWASLATAYAALLTPEAVATFQYRTVDELVEDADFLIGGQGPRPALLVVVLVSGGVDDVVEFCFGGEVVGSVHCGVGVVVQCQLP